MDKTADGNRSVLLNLTAVYRYQNNEVVKTAKLFTADRSNQNGSNPITHFPIKEYEHFTLITL